MTLLTSEMEYVELEHILLCRGTMTTWGRGRLHKLGVDEDKVRAPSTISSSGQGRHVGLR